MSARARVNLIRRRRGLRPLAGSPSLRRTASWKARRIVRTARFEHDPTIRGGARWRWAGEVLAQGQTSSARAVHDWMRSPPHRAILLKPDARQVGFARDGRTWVGHFGSR